MTKRFLAGNAVWHARGSCTVGMTSTKGKRKSSANNNEESGINGVAKKAKLDLSWLQEGLAGADPFTGKIDLVVLVGEVGHL